MEKIGQKCWKTSSKLTKKRKKKPRSSRQLHVQSQHQKTLRRHNYFGIIGKSA